jgi:hypothetical protein
VIVFVARALSTTPSMTRTTTVQSPAAGAVAVTLVVEAGLLISKPGSPSRLHSIRVIGVSAPAGVEVAVKVTAVPATTGVGVHVKSTVGCASATPVPIGDTTAPTAAKQAVSKSLT